MKLKKVLAILSAVTVSTAALGGCSQSSSSSSAAPSAAGSSPADGTSSAASTDWPKRTVNMICAFSAGGDTDYNAREIAKYLGQKLGQSFVVTNVNASGGTVAASQVKNSKADGYTCLVTNASLNVAQAAGVADFGYKDLEPACIFAMGIGEAIVVRGNSPWNSIQDMIEDSQKNPGKYKCPVNTGATTQWVAVALQNAGAKFTVVSSGSASDRLPMLLGEHIDLSTNSVSMLKDYLKTGQLKVLAINTPERAKDYPDIPTLKEAGVENCAYNQDYTILFPKDTDSAIINKMSDTVKDIVDNNKDYQSEIKTTYDQYSTCMDPQETVRYFGNEFDSLMKISAQLKGK